MPTTPCIVCRCPVDTDHALVHGGYAHPACMATPEQIAAIDAEISRGIIGYADEDVRTLAAAVVAVGQGDADCNAQMDRAFPLARRLLSSSPRSVQEHVPRLDVAVNDPGASPVEGGGSAEHDWKLTSISAYSPGGYRCARCGAESKTGDGRAFERCPKAEVPAVLDLDELETQIEHGSTDGSGLGYQDAKALVAEVRRLRAAGDGLAALAACDVAAKPSRWLDADGVCQCEMCKRIAGWVEARRG